MPEKQTPPGQEKKETPQQDKEKKDASPQDKEKKEAAQPPPQQQSHPQQPSVPQQHEPTPWPAAKPDKAPPPAPPPSHEEQPRATLQFLIGWEQRQHGQIKPGGKLVVEFDPARLPQCRQSSHGAQVWDIDVGMIFHPGGQHFGGSVMRKVRMPNEGPIVSLEPQPFEVTVPSDAAHVEMWFHNYTTLGHGCESWDSRYCQNYWYEVVK